MSTPALPEERRFKRLVRNMRRARELAAKLRRDSSIEKMGREVYRLVPAKDFDAVLETLDRLGTAPRVGEEGGR